MDTPSRPRSPWQRCYAAVLERRRARARTRAERLPRPVVSIGNLHWGGAGKTPLCLAVAAHLAHRGRRVAILSRGYGRTGREPLVVSRGAGPLVSPAAAGDEPFLLAERLPGVAVVVAAQRFLAGALALREISPAPELFLLDDGFSHVHLHRDHDILVFPRDDPWGGGRLLPSGRLREPVSAARLAHAAVLAGAGDAADLADPAEFAGALRSFGFGGPVFQAPLVLEPGALPPLQPYLLVTGIARPERALALVRSAGIVVGRHLRFPDHHHFPERDLRRIEHAFAELRGASEPKATAVLATGKDMVKLRGRLRAPLYELATRSEVEPAFFDWLNACLETGWHTESQNGRQNGLKNALDGRLPDRRG